MATTGVALDGFQLIGATPAGGRGKVTRMTGWLSNSNQRERSRRTAGHGTWSGRGWRAEKPVRVEGLITYADAAVAALERRQILALGGYDESLFTVTDSLGELVVQVEVDKLSAEPVHDRMISLVLEVTATDPFVRATTPVTFAVPAGGTQLHTAGGAAAAEIEVVTTSAGTVDLTQGGLSLLLSDVPAGTVITSGPGFTNPPRTVVGPAGEDLSSAIQPGLQWPAVVPGLNTFVSTGSADADVTYYPTY